MLADKVVALKKMGKRAIFSPKKKYICKLNDYIAHIMLYAVW